LLTVLLIHCRTSCSNQEIVALPVLRIARIQYQYCTTVIVIYL